ncbi:hypothetical protein F4821DRAFT_250332 [Hypoxylon rubiginosum]|uniref:Uncharacterized protein n=1 Tax=Hypoxylon rubiginosum TaxID=110542 RepID=A0ACC0CKT6_9PEZI|nr:hypothetical protein F4821DRAFT_250332 [Hypoxylon rubiginosum]
MAYSVNTACLPSPREPECLPFLDEERKYGRRVPGSKLVSRGIREPWLSCKALYSHLALVVIYTSVLLVIFKTGNSRDVCEARWSPAREATKWEDRNLEAFLDKSIFAGEPSPEVDSAWSELMTGINIKILPQEMDQLGISSIAFRDGSGYVGSLSVYHELHCVKKIRQWFYYDHYYANLSQHDRFGERAHVEHCIEELRVSIACHGDTTVIPYDWLHDIDQERTLLGITFRDDEPLHRCVNWDKLHKWAQSRRVDIRDTSVFTPEDDQL